MYYHLLSMCKGFLIQSWVLLPVTSGSCFFRKPELVIKHDYSFPCSLFWSNIHQVFFWTNTNCWWNKIGPNFRLQEALLLFWVVRLRDPLVFILVLKTINFEGDTIIIQTNTKPKRNGNAMVILEMSELGMFHVSIIVHVLQQTSLGSHRFAFGRGCEHFEHVSYCCLQESHGFSHESPNMILRSHSRLLSSNIIQEHPDAWNGGFLGFPIDNHI